MIHPRRYAYKEICVRDKRVPPHDVTVMGRSSFIMDFSLLSMGEFLFKRNEPMRNTKPPAMRVRIDCYTKNHLSVTM